MELEHSRLFLFPNHYTNVSSIHRRQATNRGVSACSDPLARRGGRAFKHYGDVIGQTDPLLASVGTARKKSNSGADRERDRVSAVARVTPASAGKTTGRATWLFRCGIEFERRYFNTNI